VLLLDLNAQRPDVEKAFGHERGPGLAEVLDGLYDVADVIRPTTNPNVSVLGPGFHGAGLSSRLASREMVEFLEWADENYDHTIIDTPAFLLLSDAKLLAPTVDAVLVVVGAGVSNIGMVRRCLADLEHLHANVIGIVLNRARRLRGGYMHRNLELYYAYGNESTDGKQGEDLPEMEIIDSQDEPDEAVVLLPYGKDSEESTRNR
jgi:tyrosine-protein kinase Etk/Wzc